MTKASGISVQSFRILVFALVLSLSSSTTAIAAGNPKATKSKGPTSTSTSPSPTPTSNWILPAGKNKNLVVVQAGRSLPLRFELVQSGAKVTSTEMVQISTVKLTTCDPNSAKSSPTIIVSPRPAPTVSSSASASPSVKESNELRNEKGTFSYIWKVPKNFSGCYQLQASRGDLVLVSPIISVKGTK